MGRHGHSTAYSGGKVTQPTILSEAPIISHASRIASLPVGMLERFLKMMKDLTTRCPLFRLLPQVRTKAVSFSTCMLSSTSLWQCLPSLYPQYDILDVIMSLQDVASPHWTALAWPQTLVQS